MNKLTVGLESHWLRCGPCFFHLRLVFPWICCCPLSVEDRAEPRSPRRRSSSNRDFWSPACPLSRHGTEQFLGYIRNTMTIFHAGWPSATVRAVQCCPLCTVFLSSPASKVQSLPFPLQASCLISIYKSIYGQNVSKALPSVDWTLIKISSPSHVNLRNVHPLI